jgi:quercetin dioxygenase-like cupin family protein
MAVDMVVTEDTPPAGSTPTEVIRLREVATDAISGDGVHWSLAPEGDLNVNLAHLEAGSAVATHTNTEVDVVIVVLSGAGVLSVNGSAHELTEHTLARVPKAADRSLVAGPRGLTYLTVHARRGPLAVSPRPTARPAPDVH